MEPEAIGRRGVGERLERVDRAGVDGPGRADEQRRHGTACAIGGDRGAQRGRGEPASLERHLAHCSTADPEELQGAPHAPVSFGRHVGDELRRTGEAVATHVVAGRRQRATTGAREADDRCGRSAAREQARAARVRKADELGQPAHHCTLEVDVGVIARDDARIHRRCRQRRDDSGEGRRRVDPPEEGRVAVAHGVRQNVPRHRRDQVVERRGVLRKR